MVKPITQEELAQQLGISGAMVSKLRKRGMPCESVEAAQQWRRENVAPYVRADAPPAPPSRAPAPGASAGRLDLGQERAALAREQRQRVQIQNAVQRGEYAPISMLARVLASASQAVAERFDHLPGQLRRTCPGLAPAAMEQVMATIAAARNEWVRQTAELVAVEVADMEMPELDEAPVPMTATATAALRDQLLTARLERERADAQLATLRTAEAAGELVRADDVRAALARSVVTFREGILNVPGRLSALLAAETDPGRVHAMLDLELRQALQHLSEAKPC